MGYLIAAAIVVGLVVLSKKKEPPAPDVSYTPPAPGNGYQEFIPATPDAPQLGADPSPELDPGDWDAWTKLPWPVYKSLDPNFSQGQGGYTGRVYFRKYPGVTLFQAAVYKSFVRQWPAKPTGVPSLAQAVAAGRAEKDKLRAG